MAELIQRYKKNIISITNKSGDEYIISIDGNFIRSERIFKKRDRMKGLPASEPVIVTCRKYSVQHQRVLIYRQIKVDPGFKFTIQSGYTPVDRNTFTDMRQRPNNRPNTRPNNRPNTRPNNRPNRSLPPSPINPNTLRRSLPPPPINPNSLPFTNSNTLRRPLPSINQPYFQPPVSQVINNFNQNPPNFQQPPLHELVNI